MKTIKKYLLKLFENSYVDERHTNHPCSFINSQYRSTLGL
jgi:hypothetical protein